MGLWLLLSGWLILVVADLCLVRFGEPGWVDLDVEQQEIFAGRKEQVEPWDVLVGLRLWTFPTALGVFVMILRSYLNRIAAWPLPDLAVALGLTGFLLGLMFLPGKLLGASGRFWTARAASARQRETTARSRRVERKRAEYLWRVVLGVGFVLSSMGFLDLLGLPIWAGLPVGLVFTQRRLQLRSRHLDNTRSTLLVRKRLDAQREA